MPTLTILHVETGRHLYGGALQVLYLLRGLADRGVKNILVCTEGSAIAEAAKPYAQVHAVPMHGDLDLGFIRRLGRLVRAHIPNLVHLHSRRGADVLGGMAARMAHIPAILTRRVDNPEPKWWARLKYRLYTRVITISEGIAEVLRREGVPRDKIVCVPSAVDTERFRPDCARERFRESFALPPDVPVIAMIAQFIERKGHRYLMQALPAILEKFPGACVLLFGKGPLETEVARRITTLGLTHNVRLGGFRDDLERVLPCVDLVVHPADMEGLGVSLLQAAACGVPIVGTGVGGIPEVVQDGENGLLVAPKDPGALAAAVIEILANTDRAREMGRAGRRRMERLFSIDAMVEGNLRVYHELVFGRA